MQRIGPPLRRFASAYVHRFREANRLGKVFLASLALLPLCCCFGIFVPADEAANQTDTASVGTAVATNVVQAQTTAQPTVVPPTPTRRPTTVPRPTRTIAPTEVPTAIPPTATQEPTAVPTEVPTVEPTPVPEPPAADGTVVIVNVNKQAETVTLRNDGGTAVNLRGWVLLSITGGQRHPIGGVLQPGETRVFPNDGGQIWNNSKADPAELRDPNGKVVSRYP